MKYILCGFLCLMASIGFSAVPSYQAFRGSGGITIVSNPPTGTIVIDGSGVFTSGTNSTIAIWTNNSKISGVATAEVFYAGNNIDIFGTNVNDKVSLLVGLKSNITFQTSTGPMLLGSTGSVFGFFNSTLGEWALYWDELDTSSVLNIGDRASVAGQITVSNITAVTLLGSGEYVAVNPTGIFYRTNGGSGGMISNRNILYVDPNGTTGIRGRPDAPYPHPTHAWSNAVAGDTIVVNAGLYHGCSNLMKSGVNWEGIGWPTLTYTNRTNDRGTGIFDERFSGATTSSITGFNFVYSTGLGGTNADGTACCSPTNIDFAGVLSFTNLSSSIDFDFGTIDYTCLPTVGGSQAICARAGKARVRGRSIRDLFYHTNYYVGQDDGDSPVYLASGAEGIYWERGDFHGYIDSIQMAKYGVYSSYPVAALNETNTFNLTVGKLEGVYLFTTLCTNPPNLRTFLTVNNATGSTNGNYSTSHGIQISGGGNHYIKAGRIANGNVNSAAINVSPGASTPYVRIEAQAVACDYGGAFEAARYAAISGGIVDLDVGSWVDNGAVAVGLALSGGITTIKDGTLSVTNGQGVTVGIGAQARFKNVTIDTSVTSAAANVPLTVSTNGVILDDVTLVAPAAAPSISAASAMSVISYGTYANKTNSPNVTVTVGPITIDSTVR